MILADTSVWIDHLREGDPRLVDLLGKGLVCTHPFVIGELACGTLSRRAEILSLLQALPQAARASDAEVLFFIEEHGLAGRGIGLIDAHLLAATRLSPPVLLWTRDRRLGAIASEMRLEMT